MTAPAFIAVITTIQPPTRAVRELNQRLGEVAGRLVIAGDKKGPAAYDLPHTDFLPLAAQQASGFALAELLPTGHYARKNIGYLHAIRAGAPCIYETDDDNAPLPAWAPRTETVAAPRTVAGAGWINAYRYFSADRNIWPRGFPLEQLAADPAPASATAASFRAPVQQGLVNGSPDVDAVWRLTQNRPFDFDPAAPLALTAGQWCPFNTQSTWWWPAAYPLLYVPSHCSFRMCDIWKSFVAQRCLWALGAGVVFHAPEVVQERNPHDYLRDFHDEVPGYLQNARIADILSGLDLAPGEAAVADNLLACYDALIREKIFPPAEWPLVQAWIKDCAAAA
ncbi:MAG TPA: STELLO glycosyltransferase family protein [Kiritimatiellia bacterium]|jgi:hypothetical protein|nr:DUF288 domain-containing protein [Kiritimatiellia bacterium]MBP9571618.1 DUF288 domain-containing protein [Kiritimatiellia bacterium]HQF19780.1 STELLO glycosyltransferase family protein [Kiritimatiellia bacterium]HQG73996.1 STELLO glycosyltransferase family protein [Kiritimatiellia bacterium]